MNFSQFVEWGFLGILSACGPAIVLLLWGLNNKIAIIIEKVAWHEKWLEKHDDEIRSMKVRD